MTDEERCRRVNNPPKCPKASDSLRIGLLSASRIAPNAIIRPAMSMSSVIIAGIAARDINRATIYAQEWGIPKVYESYDALLHDPEIDAIYNPLPNGLHHHWTLKALEAGKHVLLEKPGASNAEQCLELIKKAQEKNLVLLEAFHNRFHPCMQLVRALLTSEKYGTAKHVEANFLLVPGICQPTDFRYSYELAGGALMDLGYVLSAARYFLGAEPVTCLSAKATPLPGGHEKVDNELEATLDFGKGKTASIKCALSKEGLEEEVQEVTINTESHCLALKGYVVPHYGNTLTITELESGKVIKESFYKFPSQTEQVDWYSTYRYQLEVFVRRILQDTSDPFWTMVDEDSGVNEEDFLNSMVAVDMVYEKSGLGKRV